MQVESRTVIGFAAWLVQELVRVMPRRSHQSDKFQFIGQYKSEANGFAFSMISAELLLVQRIRYDALELPTEAVAHEFLDIHD